MVEPQDSGTRGWGCDTVVSLSKDTFTPRKVLVIPRKWWLCPYMTEKLFTGTLSLNKTVKTLINLLKMVSEISLKFH